MAMMAITTKKTVYLFWGSISYMARLDIRGNARSTQATRMAQNMSARKIFRCGLKYPTSV
jgi:hypothetical protein